MPFGFSETVFERSFQEMGYGDFAVQGTLQRGCQQVTFLLPEETDFWDKEIYPIASIGVEIGPVEEGKMDVNIGLNGTLVEELGLKDFKCQERKCWERVALPKGNLVKEENSLEICLGTGNVITSITQSNGSKVGLYKTADFLANNAFTMEAEKTGLVIGEKVEIKILLHNDGSGATNAEIKFARPLVEDKNAFSVVEGDSYFKGIVQAGETKEITYVIKPRMATQMTLPPAVVYYENEFGEIESKFANLVVLYVREPERKIDAFIVKQEETAFIGKEIQLTLAVKNVGNDPLYDLVVELESDAAISQSMKKIDSIQPKDTRFLEFTASSIETGRFPIGCTITYLDQNVSETQCKESFVEFKQQEINPAIYAGLALAIIAVIVYVYLMKSG